MYLCLYLQSPSSDCQPYQRVNGKPIVPCGAIANSMFNGTYWILLWRKWWRDYFLQFSAPKCGVFVCIFPPDTFKLYQIINGKEELVPFDGKGIAWWTDYNIKYRNPDYTPLKNAFNGNKLNLSFPNLFPLEKIQFFIVIIYFFVKRWPTLTFRHRKTRFLDEARLRAWHFRRFKQWLHQPRLPCVDEEGSPSKFQKAVSPNHRGELQRWFASWKLLSWNFLQYPSHNQLIFPVGFEAGMKYITKRQLICLFILHLQVYMKRDVLVLG